MIPFSIISTIPPESLPGECRYLIRECLQFVVGAVIALCDRGIERVAERLKLGFLFLPHGHLGHRSVLRSLFDFSSNGMSIGGQSIGPQSQLDG